MEKKDQMQENAPEDKKKKREKKGNPLWVKIIMRAVTIVVIALVLFIAGDILLRKYTKPKENFKYALVEKQLSYCQELVTIKYRYSDIASIKKASGFSKSYSLVKYTGIIRAGIADVTKIDYKISADGKRIFLTLPQAEILGNEILSQDIFDETNSIFIPITTQDVFDKIKASQEETCNDLITDGLLEDAYEYAKNILTQFMHSIGFEDVVINQPAK